jgi:hypothetical protein
MNFENPTFDATGNIVCVLNGLPFQITPIETPVEWADIQVQIAAGLSVAPYVAPPGKSQAELDAIAWSALQDAARAALGDSDITVLRCFEHGIAVPAEWVAYRAALRTIISAPSGTVVAGLPVKPAYPAGT